MDGNIDKVREARNKICEIELNLSNYGDDDVRNLQDNMIEGVAMLDEVISALSAIDPEAIRRALRSASKIVKENAIEMGLDDEEVYSISGSIDPDIPGNYEAILSAEPAQDDGKPEVEKNKAAALGEETPEDKRRIVAWVYPSGEWRLECSSPFAWNERGSFEVIPVMTVTELKRRIEEAKE